MNPPENLDGIAQLLDPVSLAVLADGSILADQMYDFAVCLSSPEQTEQRTQKALRELSLFTVTPETCQHPDARRGWQILTEFFQEEAQRVYLSGKGATVYVGGSLRYDDPQPNFDFDIDTAMQHRSRQDEYLLYAMRKTLAQRWPSSGKIGGHLGAIVFDKLALYAFWCRTEDLTNLTFYSSKIQYAFGAASIPLSAYPLMDPGNQYESIQKRIMEMARGTPLLAAAICLQLEGAVEIRKARRSIRAL